MQFKSLKRTTYAATSMILLWLALPDTAVTAPVSAPKTKAVTPAHPPKLDAPVSSMRCPARELQYLVGRSRAVLRTMRFGSEVRFEDRGKPYPADFNPTRTRIIIGPRGNIEKIVCG